VNRVRFAFSVSSAKRTGKGNDPIQIKAANAGILYNISVKFRTILFALLCFFCFLSIWCAQGQEPVERIPVDKNAPPPKETKPPRSDQAGPDESSSRDTQIDVTPPPGDLKDHPGADLDTPSESGEFTPWDPHKAMKSIEVGDFYFKRENYSAAISRYREALEYKPHDAEATYKLAAALEKSGDLKGAMQDYQDYLKVLPHGPYADKAQMGIDRLKQKGIAVTQATNQPR
jgi:tetratricopeptide (TPR) repeat protein